MSNALTEAWHALSPRPGDNDGPLTPCLVALTVVTGLIDAFSYLVLGHVFVANMTGNVVFLAFGLVGAKGFSIAASLLALCAFALGAAGSGRLVGRLGGRRGRSLAATAACEAILVGVSAIVAISVTSPGTGTVRYLLVAMLGLSARMQNGTARKLAVADLTTTVLTQTIAAAAFDSRLGGGPDSRIGRRGLSALAMFLGALAGAAVILHVHPPVSLLFALGLLVPVSVSAFRLSKSAPAWDRPS
jgi:uncharacterized membrane protein YoaK (UPF0700 family)